MNIISWNVCLPPWSMTRKKRLPFIVNSIIEQNADVVCLQEVFFRKDANFIIKNFAKGGYKDFFIFKDLLIISKIRLYNKEYKKFKEQGKVLSYSVLDKIYGKAFQTTYFKLKNKKIFLINCHLLSALGKDYLHYKETRQKQAIQICEFINKLNYDKIILTGDFNFNLNSESYKMVTKKYGFIDPLIKDNSPTFEKRNQRLDYFFLKKFSKTEIKENIVINNKGVSDHNGLKLKIELKKN